MLNFGCLDLNFRESSNSHARFRLSGLLFSREFYFACSISVVWTSIFARIIVRMFNFSCLDLNFARVLVRMLDFGCLGFCCRKIYNSHVRCLMFGLQLSTELCFNTLDFGCHGFGGRSRFSSHGGFCLSGLVFSQVF